MLLYRTPELTAVTHSSGASGSNWTYMKGFFIFGEQGDDSATSLKIAW